MSWLFSFSLISHTGREAPLQRAGLLNSVVNWMSQKSGKGDALRKEKALLHTFVSGQKYGVGRDATRRSGFNL